MPATTKRSKARPVQPEDLNELTFVSDPQINPDGSTILFTHKTIGTKNSYETSLWTVSTRSGDPKPFTHGPRDGHGRWSPDGGTIAFISGREKDIPQIHLIPSDGGEARCLTDLPQGSLSSFKWSPDGKSIAFTFRQRAEEWTKEACRLREQSGATPPPRVVTNTWYRLDGDGYFDQERFALHVVDIETGASRTLYAKDTIGWISYAWSPNSRTIAVTTVRNRKGVLASSDCQLLKIDAESGAITHLKDVPKGPKTEVTWSPDGKHLAWAGREGLDGTYSTENLELWTCTASGAKARSLTADTDWCLMACALSDSADVSFSPNIQWSKDSRKLLVSIGWHGQSHMASIPLSGSRPRMLSDGACVISPGNTSKDGRSVALIVDQPAAPPEVHIGRIGASSLDVRRLTGFNDEYVSSRSIRKPTMKWVRSTDGTRVQTWMITPPGFKRGRKYPAILEIHGGPHAQYGECFFHEFQVLASAGYIVMYSNPRGSKGYGRDHTAAIRGSWGGKDWEDISAVKDFMQDHPSIDSRRMGIMGGSYGGYMTVWAIGHTHDFAAAITDRCVSNLVSMGGNSDFVSKPDGYWAGAFWDSPEQLWHSSPIRTMGRAKTPTMVIHSEGDLRCNVEQGEQVFAALQIRGIPSTLVRYPRETSHGMSRNGPPDMRFHRLHQILGWWDRYIGSGRKARR
tara:strand:+ start:6698 stop:8749 length:2052 start_codon:yes stop_codon:yes gene_type:complete